MRLHLVNPRYYQNGIRSNVSVLYKKHFELLFGLMLETSSRPFCDFIKMTI